MAKLFWQINSENINKFRKYVTEDGLGDTVKHVFRYLAENYRYQKWLKENLVTQEELGRQRNHRFEYSPKISVIVPTYNTPEEYLRQMIDSVLNQSYGNWELCIADGSSPDHTARKVIMEYAEKDQRIRYRWLDENYGISGNTNKALEMTEGEYVALFDHDDVLELNCLYEIVSSLQEVHHDVIYTDEDKLYSEKGIYQTPNFKPDYSPDLLNSQNYITHFFTVKSEIIKGIGGFRSPFDGSQDYDLIFRCVEKAQSIHHIAKILYHWRMHADSTALNPESKMYCYEAGQKAIQEHYERCGIDADVTMMPAPYYGNYHTVYRLKEQPLISVIIADPGNQDELMRCVNSVTKFGRWKNTEVIIVTDQDIKETPVQDGQNVRIVKTDKEGTAAKLNLGASCAEGRYLLFLNGSAEMINRDALYEMAGLLSREETGAVGAKLLSGDETVRHAGIVIGIDGYAANAFEGADKDEEGFVMRNLVNSNYSAVSGDCMMTKADLFKETGKFDETFAAEAYDIDYCLRLRQAGKLITYNAFSRWYVTAKQTASKADRDRFREKWADVLNRPDPYYNKNLKNEGHIFQIRGF